MSHQGHDNAMELRASLLARARDLGADLAGVASVDDLVTVTGGREPQAADRLGALPATEPVCWPEEARSVVVVAVEHPRERPELDWWFGRIDPPGNRVLARVVQDLCDWAAGELGLRATHFPYHVERGGIYLKDAAVLAGLGCIGLNNLLVTPEFGPRIRLRALALDRELPSTGRSDFDPCADCGRPCRRGCPQGVFAATTGLDGTSSSADGAVPHGAAPHGGLLPARTGEFSRQRCYLQMDRDIESATLGDPAALGTSGGGAATLGASGTGTGTGPAPAPVKVIRYCRACELSCPVGVTRQT